MATPSSKISSVDIEYSNRNEEDTRLMDSEATMCESMAGVNAGASPPQDEDADSYCDYHELPPPPDGGYGWVIVFASFMCNMVVDGITYSFGVFIGELVTTFGEGKGKVAWIGSLLSGVYLSAGPLVSAFCNKYGCRAACICGSIIASAAFLLSTLSKNSNMMMVTYGFFGGIGFGFIYLPAVVAVGYYFETKRSLATGIALCGSGFGAFAFPPLCTFLISQYEWPRTNSILAGVIITCVIFGGLMKPLEFPPESNCIPLLQRMADEKRLQMERGSIGGSYFIVQMPDGTMEKRMKLPLNIDPGVHSSFNLDELVPGTPITPVPTMAVLPTITEVKVPEYNSSNSSSSSSDSSASDVKTDDNKTNEQQSDGVDSTTNEKTDSEKDKEEGKESQPNPHMEARTTMLPRNQSQPAFTTHVQGLPKNGSVPFFDRIRKTSASERFRPVITAVKTPRPSTNTSVNPTANSNVNVNVNANTNANGDVRKSTHLRSSNTFMADSKSGMISKEMWSKPDVDADSLRFATSRGSMIRGREKPEVVRPLWRKDIFYSGSVTNLPECQSMKSLQDYRQSILSIPKRSRERLTSETTDTEKGSVGDCQCKMPFKSVLSDMLNASLLKNPVFLMIGISNIVGFLGLYVPFVYLVETAKLKDIPVSSASFLISIIGITNTIGRVVCGFLSDLPWIDSMFLNNVCLVICSISVAAAGFCATYWQFVVMAVFFGIALSGFISLTSILLVDLLGLDKLTNAFGLLMLFRGAAVIVGIPLAGIVYDWTHSYTVSFLMAGAFFLISAIASFMTPAMREYVASEVQPTMGDTLTPIDEEGEDDELNEGGIIIPEIVKTNPSPVLSKSVLSQREIKQIESVL